MRPKKRVLLIDNNEQRLSVRAFVLETHHYFVAKATSVREAAETFSEARPDVVLAMVDVPGLAKLLDDLHVRDRYVQQVVIAGRNQKLASVCDVFLVEPSAAELLERVRILARRKRGPATSKPPVSDLRAHLSAMMCA